MRSQYARRIFLALTLVAIAGAAGADEANRFGIHAVAVVPPDAPNLSVVQQAITQQAHVVHFDLRSSEAGDLLVCKDASLRAALTVTRGKIFVDLSVDGVAPEMLIAVLAETGTIAEASLHATDPALLESLHELNPAARLRMPVGTSEKAAKALGAEMVTLAADDLGSRHVNGLHDAGLAVWVDTGADAALRADAVYAEADYISTADLGGLVGALREEGYYAARPLGRKWPVPPGTEISLEGTRWKRGKHTLIFQEAPAMAVKGGIVDRFFRNGVKGEYTLHADGRVDINVKGRTGSGTYDGNYLQTDGVECVRLDP